LIRRYRSQVILIIIILPITIIIIALSAPDIIKYETDRITTIYLSTVPEHVNLTVEGNSTVSKRIGLDFGDNVVTLLVPKLEVPPSIDRNLTLHFNNTTPTSEYFVYVIANNSKYVFPEGSYEGIIRFYYNGTTGKVLNKAVPIDVSVVKNAKND
jgi:hypothetical protein